MKQVNDIENKQKVKHNNINNVQKTCYEYDKEQYKYINIRNKNNPMKANTRTCKSRDYLG